MSSVQFPNSLLPANSSALEHALDALAEQKLAFDLAPVDLHPQTCPAHLLPLLAAQWRVDIANMNEVQQRILITNAFEIHRYKGTVYAVKKALASVFSDSSIVEFDPRTEPELAFKFDAKVQTSAEPNAVYDVRQFDLAVRLINKAKNARSRLRHFEIQLPEARTEIEVQGGGVLSYRASQDLQLTSQNDLVMTTAVIFEINKEQING